MQRKNLVNKALSWGETHIFIEADILFSKMGPDTCLQLLHSVNAPIVSGLASANEATISTMLF
jgi:hypothetical protein